MSKYVIDTDDFPFYVTSFCATGTNASGQSVYAILDHDAVDELTAEYVNEHFGDLHEGEYECAYNKGLEDAWELARKLVWDNSINELEQMGFNIPNTTDEAEVLKTSTVHEAITKLREYEQKQEEDAEIKVGDEVTYTFETGETIKPFVVVYIKNNDDGGRYYQGIEWESKRFVGGGLDYVKTGRHFPEVAQLLEKMKGGE